MSDPLAELKDIHVSTLAQLWPPAPGWWLLALVVLVLLPALLWLGLRQRRRTAWRRLALQELKTLQTRVTDETALMAAVDQLLRRAALAAGSHPELARLQGDAWQEQLARHMPAEQAQLLAHGRYQPDSQCQRQTLLEAARHWLKGYRP